MIWQLQSRAFPDRSSYLFGSMHVRDKRAFIYLDLVKSILDNCSNFYAEIAISEYLYSKSDSLFLLPDGMTIQDFVKANAYAKMHKQLKKSFNIDLIQVDRFLPMAVTNLLAEKSLNCEMENSVDNTVWDLAKNRGLVCDGLESLEEQTNLLKTIPISFQVKQLMKISKNIKKFRQQQIKLVTYYSMGDYKKLYHEGKRSLGKYRKVMLYKRNERMTNRIVQEISKDTCFFMIGAGHIYGDKGVIALLKRNNIRVSECK